MKLTVNVDGGSRGNPGPAAAAAVIKDSEGNPIASESEFLGQATNNVAEYRALLLGIKKARELGATEVELIGDSELVVKQVRGEYKVKHAAMKPLYAEVVQLLQQFDSWQIRHVLREQNSDADALVNATLDAA